MNVKEELNLLFQLAKVDNKVVHQETEMISYLGEAYGLTKEEIQDIFKDNTSILNINLLSRDEKYNCLYNLIHLMKVDQMVFHSEIKFCQKIAERLGYKVEVVPELAAHIFSNSDINKNKLALKELSENYLLK